MSDLRAAPPTARADAVTHRDEARVLLLRAIEVEKACKDVLKELRKQVLPVYREAALAGQVRQGNLAVGADEAEGLSVWGGAAFMQMHDAESLDAPPPPSVGGACGREARSAESLHVLLLVSVGHKYRAKLRGALTAWAEPFHLDSEPWILLAALRTVATWYETPPSPGQKLRWATPFCVWLPEPPPIIFELSGWRWWEEDRDAACKRLLEGAQRLIEDSLTDATTQTSHIRPGLWRHYLWTARDLAGEDPNDHSFGETHARIAQTCGVSPRTVDKAVQGVRKLAGLTPRGRGRR